MLKNHLLQVSVYTVLLYPHKNDTYTHTTIYQNSLAPLLIGEQNLGLSLFYRSTTELIGKTFGNYNVSVVLC